MIKEHSPQRNRVMPRPQWIPVIQPLFIAVAIACLLLSSLSLSAAPTSKGMIGFNWPDNRDNYSNDLLVPIGLDRTDSQAVIVAKTERIVHQARALSGANTFRMPINYLMTKSDPAAAAWWTKYCASIDKIIAMGNKVIICPWHVREYAADGTTLTAYVNIPFAPGLVAQPTSKAQMFSNIQYFWDMWQVVIARYANNPRVYFEIWNEPGQCTKEEWVDICTEWLRRYPAATVPRHRVIVAGTGWSWGVYDVAYNPTFNDCLLAFHIYSTQGNFTKESDWFDRFNHCMQVDPDTYPGHAASVLSRVLVTEYGSTGKGTMDDYSDPTSSVSYVVFTRALAKYMQTHNMGGTGWGILHKPFQVWGDKDSTTPFLHIHNATYLGEFVNGFDFQSYSGTYKIRNKRIPGEYLYRNLTDIATAPDWGQTWTVTYAWNGYYRISSGGYNLCATDNSFDGGATMNRKLVAVAGAVSPWDSSLWKIIDQGDGTVKIWNKEYPNYSPRYTTVPLPGSNFQQRVTNEAVRYGLGDYTSWVLVKQ